MPHTFSMGLEMTSWAFVHTGKGYQITTVEVGTKE